MTGFVNNAITPFFMREGSSSLPIVLSEAIFKLKPPYFWMGGGRVELKMGVSVDEFINYFGRARVHIADIVF